MLVGTDSAGAGARELEALLEALDRLRATALRKLDGLGEEEVRRSTVASGTNLAGLIQHLTFVESRWFEQKVAGRTPTRGRRSMLVDPSVSLRQLRSDYRTACAESNAIVRRIGDPDAPLAAGAGTAQDLRRAILAVIDETARHAGHADIIREQIDGTTGR